MLPMSPSRGSEPHGAHNFHAIVNEAMLTSQ